MYCALTRADAHALTHRARCTWVRYIECNYATRVGTVRRTVRAHAHAEPRAVPMFRAPCAWRIARSVAGTGSRRRGLARASLVAVPRALSCLYRLLQSFRPQLAVALQSWCWRGRTVESGRVVGSQHAVRSIGVRRAPVLGGTVPAVAPRHLQ